MRFTQDRKLVDKVDNAVHSALKQLGYTSLPGRYWIIEAIQNEDLLPDQDWSSPEVVDANIETLIAEASKWLKRVGVKPRPKGEQAVPPERTHTSIGWAYRTAQRIHPSVVKARQWLFNTSDAPFADDSEGHRLALKWLREVSEKDAQHLAGRQPGRVEISFVLETDDAAGLLRRASSWQIEQMQKTEGVNLESSTKDLTGNISAVDYRIVAWQVGGGYKTYEGQSMPFQMLELPNGDGWREVIVVPPTTRLAELADRVSEIARAAGWWTPMETLDYVLCGSVPIPGVRAGVHQPKSGPHAITLTVRGPATEDEVIKAYTAMLEEFGLRPKPLKSAQGAVLKLVAKTPDLSWGERYKVWLQWCDANADLPDFNRNPKSGPPSLYNTYKRAVEKVRW